MDGVQAPLENYAGLDATQRITREVHPAPEISWYPGWQMRLSKGKHHLVLSLHASKTFPLLSGRGLIAAYKELPDPNVIPDSQQPAPMRFSPRQRITFVTCASTAAPLEFAAVRLFLIYLWSSLSRHAWWCARRPK